MVLASMLKRGALRQDKRIAGLSAVAFGLVASLGRRPPISVVRLAEAVGMDKGQISRALAGLVSRKPVSRSVNPRDNREVLAGLREDEAAMLLRHVDELTETAGHMLDAERALD